MSLTILLSEQRICIKKVHQAKSLSHISKTDGILKSDGPKTIKSFDSCS